MSDQSGVQAERIGTGWALWPGMKVTQHFPGQPIRTGIIEQITEQGVFGHWTKEYCLDIHRAFALSAGWLVRMLNEGHITIEEESNGNGTITERASASTSAE